jgi:hypothetical protein
MQKRVIKDVRNLSNLLIDQTFINFRWVTYLENMVIHKFLVSIIWGFWPKIHKFSLLTYIGAFQGPVIMPCPGVLLYSQLPITPCPLVDSIYYGLWESWGNSNSLSSPMIPWVNKISLFSHDFNGLMGLNNLFTHSIHGQRETFKFFHTSVISSSIPI